ncbi:protein Skeletor, isoforms B/C-like [Amphiura filiformis]|uniref:protein Skeletor, isoforms B/C-like n=1 Tax=Amphiura filiformis TaxID=82378 RepID=UPI003B21148B
MATFQDNCCGLTRMTTILVVVGIVLQNSIVTAAPYYGKRIGTLSSYAHRVTGEVYAASDKRLYLTGFTYDGRGPDAFVWMGNTPTGAASSQGQIISADGSSDILGSYSNAVVQVDLPDSTTLADYKWISIWCRRYAANFGELVFPTDPAPVPKSLGTLGFPSPVHGVRAGDVIILNNRQIKLVNLDYDGNGPDAYYWAGSGGTPTSSGFALADESRGGSLTKLPRGTALTDVTVTLTVPANRGDIGSIGYVGLWCVAFSQNFGHVVIPSLSELGVPVYDDSPPVTNAPVVTQAPPQANENCQVLIDDTYQVRWSLTDTSAIQISLSARINPGTYMAFGLSGSDTRTLMIGSDVTVAWLDAETGAMPKAVDYHLSAYQQCVTSSGSGACTDELSQPSGSNDVTVGDYSNDNGIITISYTKPLDTGDTNTDKVIPINNDVYVAWSIGPINPSGLAAKHRQQPTSNVPINFGQTGVTCPAFTTGQTEKLEPWVIPTIRGDMTGKTEFRVDIGQAGGQQGYEGITGKPGWGIAWYVDDYIIPVLTLRRGVTYTFIVQGGNEANIQARYHPFYITNDAEGGYIQKTAQETQGVEIYAGPVNGSLCEWRSTGAYNADDFDTFVKYRDAELERVCDDPFKTATLTWTPDENTPNRVYYQCYTHKFLGWKIDIIDNDADTSTMKSGDSGKGDTSTMKSGGTNMPKTTAAGWVTQGNKLSIITTVIISMMIFWK